MGTPSSPGDSVPDRGPILISMTWSLTGLALITTVLRLAKHRIFGWDDGFMMLTMNLAMVQLFNWLSQVFGIMGVAFGKVSISALLLGIIGSADLHWQRYYIWAVTVWLSLAIGIACSVLTFSQCQPAQALWDMRVVGRCIDPTVMSSFGTFTGSWNTFADASLAILPATIFWKLNCTRAKKAQLSIVFGFNILTSVCSGIKTQYLVELSNRTDFTWATYDIFVWVTAELFLMVFCGTIPTLYPLYSWIARLYSQTIVAMSSKGGSAYIEQDHELSGVQVRTMTTVEHRQRKSFTESADNLVMRGDGEVMHHAYVKAEESASGDG